MSKSRTEYATKNFIWSMVGYFSNNFLGFASRTVFIYTLGTVYLGINGLFSNILGLMSLAELGVGSAISFSLYKPLAEQNISKIQAIINLYRTAYRIISSVILVLGILLIPCLKYIVNGADDIDNVTFIYCIFLFNTVTSYLVTYKITLLSSDQRNYILTNVNTMTKLITTVIQIGILVITKNFVLYLVINTVIQLVMKIYLNKIVDKQYPYIKGKNNERLSPQEKTIIYNKVKALMFHKIGSVSIFQTDNIITSVFISVNAVGIVSNFTMIIGMVNGFIMSFFSSTAAGMGNIIATETKEKSLIIFKRFDFLTFCFYGWSTICLYFLLNPFITLWIGADKLINNITVGLLCVNYYFTGMRASLENIKYAAGVFEQDRWAPIAESVINIVASIILAKYLGLIGVYMGTLISSMVPNIERPYIIYKYIFGMSCKSYFIESCQRFALLGICISIIEVVIHRVNITNPIAKFIFIMVISTVIPLQLIYIIYRKNDGLLYAQNIIKSVIMKGRKKMEFIK